MKIGFLFFALLLLIMTDGKSADSPAEIIHVKLRCPSRFGFIPIVTNLNDFTGKVIEEGDGNWSVDAPRRADIFVGFTGSGILYTMGKDLLFPKRVTELGEGEVFEFPLKSLDDFERVSWKAHVKVPDGETKNGETKGSQKFFTLYIEGTSPSVIGQVQQVLLQKKATTDWTGGFLELPIGEYRIALLPDPIALGVGYKEIVKHQAIVWTQLTVTAESAQGRIVEFDFQKK